MVVLVGRSQRVKELDGSPHPQENEDDRNQKESLFHFTPHLFNVRPLRRINTS